MERKLCNHLDMPIKCPACLRSVIRLGAGFAIPLYFKIMIVISLQSLSKIGCPCSFKGQKK